MPPRRAVVRWRTSAALAALALLSAGAASCAQGSPAQEHRAQKARHARIVPAGHNPFRVKGTGFAPRERVRVTVTGLAQKKRTLRAGARGSFVVRFAGVSSCDSVTVRAVGSKGSRASFNISQVVCNP